MKLGMQRGGFFHVDDLVGEIGDGTGKLCKSIGLTKLLYKEK
jgi:hypothetical protein